MLLFQGFFVANVSFDVSESGLKDDIYEACFDRILNAFNDFTSEVNDVKTLGGGECTFLTLTTGNSVQHVDYVCNGAEMAVPYDITIHKCCKFDIFIFC